MYFSLFSEVLTHISDLVPSAKGKVAVSVTMKLRTVYELAVQVYWKYINSQNILDTELYRKHISGIPFTNFIIFSYG